jgi:putative zinc finger/helix-turn-helix YgiT family protein
MDKCYVCGHTLETVKDKPYEYTECGLDVILLGITQYVCNSCGEEYAALPHPEKLHKAIGLYVCKKKKALLLPEEIKFLRKELNLKAKDLASSLGVDDSTVSRWENGKKQIGEGSDRLLRALYLGCVADPCEEKDRCSNILDVFKSFPSQRKEVKEHQQILLNPQDWLIPSCACLNS